MVGEPYLKDVILDRGYEAPKLKMLSYLIVQLKVDSLYSIGETYFDILWDVLYDRSNYGAIQS